MSDEVEYIGDGKLGISNLGWWDYHGWWHSKRLWHYRNEPAHFLGSWWCQVDIVPSIELCGHGQLAFSPSYGYGQAHTDTEAQITGSGSLVFNGNIVKEDVVDIVGIGRLTFFGNISNDIEYAFSYGWWNPYGWWPYRLGWWWLESGDYQQQSRYV